MNENGQSAIVIGADTGIRKAVAPEKENSEILAALISDWVSQSLFKSASWTLGTHLRATIDVPHLAIDERAVVGCQKRDRAGDVTRLA